VIRRVWPAYPYPLQVIACEEKILAPVGVSVHYVGKDGQYASNWLDYFDRADTDGDELFMLWLDDYILRGVDEELVRVSEAVARRPDVSFVRMSQQFTPAQAPLWAEDARFRMVLADDPYSFSQQICIFKKAFFRSVLRAGEDPWQTEQLGSMRVREMGKRAGTLLGLAEKEALQKHNAYSHDKVDRGTMAYIAALIGSAA
jgi:hypothetical protein